MTHEISVKGIPRCPPGGNTTKEFCPIDGTRGIDREEGAAGSTHKAVIHAVRVRVVSRDGPGRVDGWSGKRLTPWPDRGVCRAWGIECGDGAAGGAQEAVERKAVIVGPRDRPHRVDAIGADVHGGRNIERGEGPGLRDEGPRFGYGVRARGSLLCIRLQAFQINLPPDRLLKNRRDTGYALPRIARDDFGREGRASVSCTRLS